MTRRPPLAGSLATLIHARQIGCPPPDGQVPDEWVTRAAEDIAWILVRHLDNTPGWKEAASGIVAELERKGRT